jgi:tRNA(Ile)-lysidine synthase
MDVVLPSAGSYVVAVSGGVDSITLLDMLRKQPGLKLVVAHFDHGMRSDSAKDRRVESVAKKQGLDFVYEEGNLGPQAGEAAARQARYDFLRGALKNTGSAAIITAHHQDDVLETAIINILRGTGRKGLTSLRSQPQLLRPLLKITKQELLAYAAGQGLDWREDATNQDTAYLRNYVRHKLLPRFSEPDKRRLVNILATAATTNQELDEVLDKLLDGQAAANQLDRRWFNNLPHAAAREIMAAWLRSNGLSGFDSQTLERLVIAAKTARPGKNFPAKAGYLLEVKTDNLALAGPER